MPKILLREIDKLKKGIVALGALVEDNLRLAVQSVEKRDPDLARRVLEMDHQIDQAEVDLEEECLKILALHQPVAIDLRFIIAVLKINNDLERIGDLAVNIAERAILLCRTAAINEPFDFPTMAAKSKDMLRQSLDALVNINPSQAYAVCKADDEVDDINRAMYEQVKNGLRRNPGDIECLIHMLGVSRTLERVADHATNIAEDVIYMATGEIVRHHRRDEFMAQVTLCEKDKLN